MSVAGGNYAVLRQLGGNATTEVLLAAQYGLAGLVKLVVLKRLRPQVRGNPLFVKTFVQQSRLAASLDQVNIVTTYDVHQDAQDVYVAMEYLSGEDLGYLTGRAARQELRIPVGVSCRIISQAAEALHHIHSAVGHDGNPLNLTHGDLQPGHVMACYSGVTKLLNTGLAKADPQDAYVLPGTLKHRLAYRAPERIQYGAVDHRSDLYSLGVLLHELLTGRPLFRHDSEAELVKLLMEQRVSPPSKFNHEIPPELDKLTLAAVDRDPDNRPQSAQELREGIDRILSRNPRTMGDDLGRWMQSALGSRYAERQQIERGARAEAMTGPTGSSGGDLPQYSEVSSPGTSSQATGSASGLGLHPVASGTRTSMGPARRGRSRLLLVMLLASLATLLVVSIFGLAYYIGRDSTEGQDGPTGANKALLVHVRPLGAQLIVDGEVRAEAVDAAGVFVPTQRQQSVTLEAILRGHKTQRAIVSAPERATKEVYLSLPPLVGETSAPAAAPASSRPVVLAPVITTGPPAGGQAPGLPVGLMRLLLFVLLPLAGLLVGGGLGGLLGRRLSRRRAPRSPAEAGSAAQVGQLTDENNRLRSSLAVAKEKATDLGGEVSKLKQRIDAEQATGAPSAQSVPGPSQAELAALTEELAQTKAQLRLAEEGAAAAEQRQAEAEAARGELASQLQAAQRELAARAAPDKASANDDKNLSAELKRARDENSKLKRECETTRAALRRAQTDASKAHAEVEASRIAMNRAETRETEQVPPADGDVGKLTVELQQKKAALEQVQSQVDALEGELRAARVNMNALEKARSQVDSLEKELQAARKRGDGDQPAPPAANERLLTVGAALDQDPNLSWKQRETIRMLYQGFVKKED